MRIVLAAARPGCSRCVAVAARGPTSAAGATQLAAGDRAHCRATRRPTSTGRRRRSLPGDPATAPRRARRRHRAASGDPAVRHRRAHGRRASTTARRDAAAATRPRRARGRDPPRLARAGRAGGRPARRAGVRHRRSARRASPSPGERSVDAFTEAARLDPTNGARSSTSSSRCGRSRRSGTRPGSNPVGRRQGARRARRRRRARRGAGSDAGSLDRS